MWIEGGDFPWKFSCYLKAPSYCSCHLVRECFLIKKFFKDLTFLVICNFFWFINNFSAITEKSGDASHYEKKITELERQKADMSRKLRGIYLKIIFIKSAVQSIFAYIWLVWMSWLGHVVKREIFCWNKNEMVGMRGAKKARSKKLRWRTTYIGRLWSNIEWTRGRCHGRLLRRKAIRSGEHTWMELKSGRESWCNFVIFPPRAILLFWLTHI